MLSWVWVAGQQIVAGTKRREEVRNGSQCSGRERPVKLQEAAGLVVMGGSWVVCSQAIRLTKKKGGPPDIRHAAAEPEPRCWKAPGEIMEENSGRVEWRRPFSLLIGSPPTALAPEAPFPPFLSLT